MNGTEFANQKFFYNFNFSPFCVGRVLMIAISPTGKKYKVYMRSKVRGFEGTSRKEVGYSLLCGSHC
jgi:hypothetical protein